MTVPSSPLTMSPCKSRLMPNLRQPRPVFLPAALQRLLRQPISSRPRLFAQISAYILSTIAWWLRRGLRHIAPTLLAARDRLVLQIHPERPKPSFDIYAPAHHQAYVTECVNYFKQRTSPSSTNVATHPPPPLTPMVMYVHGGAWGAGTSLQFAQMGRSISCLTGATTLVLSYRVYPEAKIAEQVKDVTDGMRAARGLFPGRRLVVMAHSSGAHVTAAALLKGAERGEGGLADVVVFSGGVFDLGRHFLYEGRRGIAEMSPLLPAARADEDVRWFEEWSTRKMVEALRGRVQEWGEDEWAGVGELEGDLAGREIWLPEVQRRGQSGNEKEVMLPKTFMMVSSGDVVVPVFHSIKFAGLLRSFGVDCRFLMYDVVDHMDFVIDWYEGEGRRDLSDVADLGEEEEERRECVLRMLGGKSWVRLRREGKEMNVASHVADVIRILKSLAVAKKDVRDPSAW
eukprot:GFKZ01007000.1.p1 GENE.GFKZ01007000.1~~GFKZ01007000.1.p1  ORF type:complete len:457 (+),score=58.78 GFKZ01007000.1:213-1583(+)